MAEGEISRLLRRLRTGEAQDAWSEFLQQYSPLIFQVVHLFERDLDHRENCFLFVCEQLSRNRFRRLRQFRLHGPASFSTWLRAVVRNLCLDWHRKEFGRQRVFQSIAHLSALDQEVFRYIFVQGLSEGEALYSLLPSFPGLTEKQLAHCEDRLRQALTPRQRWLLSLQQAKAVVAGGPGTADEPNFQTEVVDPDLGPEALAARNEQRAALGRALARLPRQERYLLRLRFEQGLTLGQIARVTGLGNPQRVERRLREILDRLRGGFGR